MLSNPNTDPPAEQPTRRKDMLRYMERFGRWARKLGDDDLGMVVAFCANVQMAWNDGRQKPATTAEQVAEGTVEIPPPAGLPGLGAPLEQVVREGSDGQCEVTLPEGMSIEIRDLKEDDDAAN